MKGVAEALILDIVVVGTVFAVVVVVVGVVVHVLVGGEDVSGTVLVVTGGTAVVWEG